MLFSSFTMFITRIQSTSQSRPLLYPDALPPSAFSSGYFTMLLHFLSHEHLRAHNGISCRDWWRSLFQDKENILEHWQENSNAAISIGRQKDSLCYHSLLHMIRKPQGRKRANPDFHLQLSFSELEGPNSLREIENGSLSNYIHP